MRKKLLIVIAAVVILGGATIGALVYYNKKSGDSMAGMDMGGKKVVQSHHTYSLNLMQSMAYKPNQPSELMFDIRDENNNVLKDFDTVHTKLMHLIVVRKDRTNFQHVHPNFDKASGMFAIIGFKFPTDGEYRVFADFTATDAQKDDMGMKLATTPFKDVKVGDGNYTPETLGADKLTSDVNGFSTTIAPMGGDSATVVPTISSGMPQMLAVTINKDGAPYKNLQTYLSALGHMVVLGPNLEFIHGHPSEDPTSPQTGLISFMVTFPDPGQYKLYLQTQANNQVNTTDYNMTVQAMPGSNKQGDQSMQGMSH